MTEAQIAYIEARGDACDDARAVLIEAQRKTMALVDLQQLLEETAEFARDAQEELKELFSI